MFPAIAYDTETTGLSPHTGDRMFAFSTCDAGGHLDVQRVDRQATPRERRDGRKTVEQIWNGEHEVVMHNAKFDMAMTEYYLKRNLRRVPIHDTLIQSHILRNNHPNHRLKELAWELAGYRRDDEKEVKTFVRTHKVDYSQVPRALMERYQAGDAERTMLLHMFLYPKIQASAPLQEVYDTEIALTRTTLRMERRGLMIRQEHCRRMISELGEKMEIAKAQLTTIAGEKINPRADDTLRWLLYKKLGLPVLKRTAKERRPSTDKETLAKLQEHHSIPAVDAILRFRSFARGRTIIQQYLDLGGDSGIIHPNKKSRKPRLPDMRLCYGAY